MRPRFSISHALSRLQANGGWVLATTILGAGIAFIQFGIFCKKSGAFC
jgi:hypothetical protein